jgi:hypothetical protein
MYSLLVSHIGSGEPLSPVGGRINGKLLTSQTTVIGYRRHNYYD